MLKKIIAIILTAVLGLGLMSCTNTDDEAPEGMFSVTLPDEPFVLYVPTTWKDNSSSGISGAYYMSSAVNGAVSARYFTSSDSDLTVGAYLESCVASLRAAYADSEFELVDNVVAAFLGGKAAQKISYTFKSGDVKMLATQTTLKYSDNMITLYTYVSSDNAESRKEDFDKISQNFKLLDTKATAEPVTEGAPEGMQVVSSEDVEYKFYAPLSWKCNRASAVTEAYYPESGRPNVTVTSYIPDGSYSVDDYFKKVESELVKEFSSGYERLSADPASREVDGRSALSYTYAITFEGKTVNVRQTIFVFDSSFYSVTYSALEDSFASHLADVDLMLDHFTFG